MKHSSLLVLSTFLLAVSAAYSHPGGQDDQGGHFNRSTGTYHCHTETCESEISEDSLDWPDGDPNAASLTVSGSWGAAKKVAKNIIYANKRITFYCGCEYSATKNKEGIKIEDCAGYKEFATYKSRATTLEWEHVVPASLMPARQFPCWNQGLPGCKKGSRACCERKDLNAKAMIFDLHNMVPSVGQANALRSDKRYGVIPGDELPLGCDIEFDKETGITEPPANRLGDVARIWLYMHQQHGVVLEAGELQMYMSWSQNDPPDIWEFERDDRIKANQGNSNPFVGMFR